MTKEQELPSLGIITKSTITLRVSDSIFKVTTDDLGVWGYKTSITLEQYLVDHGYYLGRVDGRFSQKAQYQLSRFLADYERSRN